MDNLLSVEFRSVAFGWRYFNTLESVLGREKELQVIEASPLSRESFWLFLSGPLEELEKIKNDVEQKASSQLSKMALLQSVKEEVRLSLYSLQQEKLQKFLAVIELESVSQALQVSHEITQETEVKLVETVNGRGMSGLSLIYLTGEESLPVEAKLKELKKRGQVTHFEVIQPLSPLLKDYFEIENL